MKNNDLEKNIKEQLESYENFDGDKMAMWNEIEQELDKKKKRGFFWLWLGAGALLIGLAISWMIFDNKKEVEITKNQTSQQSNYKKDKAVKTINSDVSQVAETKANPSTSESNISQSQHKNINFSPQKPIGKTPTTVIDNNTITNTIFNASKKTKSENSTTAKVSVGSSKETTETVVTNSSQEDVVFLPKLFLLLPEKKDDVTTLDSAYYFKPKQEDSLEYKWGISIGGGINAATTGYNNTSTFSSLRKKSESSMLGWNLQLELERRLPKNFFITSGVHFNRNWMQFNYKSTKEEVEFLENVLLRFDLDLAVGDTTFYYGDTSITTTITRDIRHHNQYDKLKIPILFGKKWSKNNFSYGGFAGVGLDIWLQQKGRNLSPDEVVINYDSKMVISSAGFPRFGFSADFRGEVNYKIGKRHHLFLQPNLSVSLSNWSNSNYNIVQRPITFGVNLGYQIKF